jgi:hypothetical protein
VNRDFAEMLSALNAEGVEYLVVGGWALAAHGYPRATKDLDVFVRPSDANAERVLKALQRFGAPGFGVTAKDLSAPGLVLQLGMAPLRIDVITAIDGVEFDEAWQSRWRASFAGVEAPVIGRDALVRNKRAAGRPRDHADADLLEGLD